MTVPTSLHGWKAAPGGTGHRLTAEQCPAGCCPWPPTEPDPQHWSLGAGRGRAAQDLPERQPAALSTSFSSSQWSFHCCVTAGRTALSRGHPPQQPEPLAAAFPLPSCGLPVACLKERRLKHGVKGAPILPSQQAQSLLSG